jgi:mevalonate kinase
MQREPEKYARLFDEAAQLVEDAQKQLEEFDLERVGALMNRNHELLQQIGVSCNELDTLVNLARDVGALGAKMTGTGRGGYMLALTPGMGLQQRVAAEIEKKGFQALRTTIGI